MCVSGQEKKKSKRRWRWSIHARICFRVPRNKGKCHFHNDRQFSVLVHGRTQPKGYHLQQPFHAAQSPLASGEQVHASPPTLDVINDIPDFTTIMVRCGSSKLHMVWLHGCFQVFCPSSPINGTLESWTHPSWSRKTCVASRNRVNCFNVYSASDIALISVAQKYQPWCAVMEIISSLYKKYDVQHGLLSLMCSDFVFTILHNSHVQ